MHSCRWFLACLAIAVAGSTPVLAAAPPLALPDDQVATRTRQVVEQILQRPEAVGLSVAVARGERILVELGAGSADLEFDVPANAETIFRIGSVTKQFTAASIMKLVERQKLALDDDVHKYVPTFDTEGRVITIRQLLNHASGVPNYTNQPRVMQDFAPRDLTDEQLLATVKGVKFDFEPGKGWNYSNTGYYLLGMVIQAADGRPYDRFMQEEFFTPLGLTRTRQGSDRQIIKNRAQGYAGTGSARLNDASISMNVPGGAGALSSTAGDLLRWQIALVNGRAVTAASYQQMTGSTVSTGQGNARYGFGLNVSEANGVRRISHSGGIFGFNSVLTYLPDSATHVAVISNSETLPSGVVAEQILAVLAGGAMPAMTRTAPKASAEAALRQLMDGVARGAPAYDRMGARLAMAVRDQLSATQARLQALGAVGKVTFVNVDMAGNDVFNVEFADGSVMTFVIGIDDAGILQTAAFRPAAGAPAR